MNFSIFFSSTSKMCDDFRFSRNLSLQICFCIVAISILECRNCLMYIQDSVPFSEYCLIMCLGWYCQIVARNALLFTVYIESYVLVPMFVIGLIEIQFYVYLTLIRHRFRLLNKLLLHFGEILHSDANVNSSHNSNTKKGKNIHFSSARKIIRTKSHSFEYFRNGNNSISSSYLFKKPSLDSSRYGLTFYPFVQYLQMLNI